MNYRKLVGAVVIALVSIGLIGIALPASADSEPTYADAITISGPSVAGRTFKSVRIAEYTEVEVEVEGEDDDTVTSFALKTADGSGFPTLLATEIARIAGNPAPHAADGKVDGLDPLFWVALHWSPAGQDVWGNPNADNPNVRELANWLESQTSLFNTWVPATSTDSVPAGGVERVKIETTEGLHFVWEDTTVEHGDDVKVGTRPLAMIVGTNFYDSVGTKFQFDGNGTLGEINVKGDLVYIDKDIQEAINAQDAAFDGAAKKGEVSEVEDSWTATTGDTIKFVIRTNVPNYPNPPYVANDVTFKITDTYTDGLDPDWEDFEIWEFNGNTWEQVTNPTDEGSELWSATPVSPGDPGEAGESSYEIKLTTGGIDHFSGKHIEVRYSATVTAGALKDDSAYTTDTNRAQVTFTDLWDTSGLETAKTEPDCTYVYTFPLNVFKRDLLSPSGALLAASFEVLQGDATVGTIDTGDNPGAYESTGYLLGGFIVDVNAASKVVGLAANTWYLVAETKAPYDYTDANLGVAKFWVYIGAGLGEDEVSGLKYYFKDWEPDVVPSGVPGSSSITSPYVNPVINFWEESGGDDAANMTVLVLNAKSASDMPSTGGQILFIAGLAGALGLGAVTFGALGLRKRKAAAANAA